MEVTLHDQDTPTDNTIVTDAPDHMDGILYAQPSHEGQSTIPSGRAGYVVQNWDDSGSPSSPQSAQNSIPNEVSSDQDTLNPRQIQARSAVARGKRTANPTSSQAQGTGILIPPSLSYANRIGRQQRYFPPQRNRPSSQDCSYGQVVDSTNEPGNTEMENSIKEVEKAIYNKKRELKDLEISAKHKERDLLEIEGSRLVVLEELQSLREQLDLLRMDPMGCNSATRSESSEG